MPEEALRSIDPVKTGDEQGPQQGSDPALGLPASLFAQQLEHLERRALVTTIAWRVMWLVSLGGAFALSRAYSFGLVQVLLLLYGSCLLLVHASDLVALRVRRNYVTEMLAKTDRSLLEAHISFWHHLELRPLSAFWGRLVVPPEPVVFTGLFATTVIAAAFIA